MANDQRGANQESLERPADPFKALGNETRLEIIKTLYERTRGSAVGTETIPYSTLREAVGIADKGNFNYHLRQLDGQFLANDGDGYRLTFAGFEIAKVIDVDAWRSHEPRGPVAVADAENGSEPLTAVYEDSVVEVRRGDDPLYAHAVRPAGAADRETELSRLLDVAATLWRHTVEQLLEGICPYCQATVVRSLEVDDDAVWTYSFAATCNECGPLGGSHVGIAALPHPAVVSFCWERGVDLTDRHPWTLPFVDDDAVAVAGEEPLELRVDVELEGDRLAVFVDDDVEVVDVERQ